MAVLPLKRSPTGKRIRGEDCAGLEFKLSKADLREISFFVHQPDNNRRMEYELPKGDISDAVIKPGGS